jgi:hypothetical protein
MQSIISLSRTTSITNGTDPDQLTSMAKLARSAAASPITVLHRSRLTTMTTLRA